MTALSSDTAVFLANFLPRLVYVLVAIYFLRGAYCAVAKGYLFAFEERIEKVSRPKEFWFSFGLMALVGCICLYGAIAHAY